MHLQIESISAYLIAVLDKNKQPYYNNAIELKGGGTVEKLLFHRDKVPVLFSVLLSLNRMQ